jgi:hypothetical protein
MDWRKIENFLATGQAFVPVNVKDQGDSVQLYLKDGSSELLDMQCGTFLNKLLTYFGTSLSVNRARYGTLVGKKQLVPIILSYGITLIPFNVREPIGKQTRTGWFITKEISNFSKQSPYDTLVQLGKHEISVMHSEKFCFEQLKNARCIEFCYGEIHEPHRKKWLFTAG